MCSFCMQCKSYSHFFSKKYQYICVSLNVNFNESLTNDIVSFEQLGPGVSTTYFHGESDEMKEKKTFFFINFSVIDYAGLSGSVKCTAD